MKDKSMHETQKYYRQRLNVSWGHKLWCQDFICENTVPYVHQNYLMPQSDIQNQRCYRKAEGTVSWNQCGKAVIYTECNGPYWVNSALYCKYSFHYICRESLCSLNAACVA